MHPELAGIRPHTLCFAPAGSPSSSLLLQEGWFSSCLFSFFFLKFNKSAQLCCL